MIFKIYKGDFLVAEGWEEKEVLDSLTKAKSI